MKKIVVIAFFATLLVANLTNVTAYENHIGNSNLVKPTVSVESRSSICVVLENNVNFRTGPGTNYPSLGQVHKGTGLLVTTGGFGGWHHIINILDGPNAGRSGWISSNYIRC